VVKELLKLPLATHLARQIFPLGKSAPRKPL